MDTSVISSCYYNHYLRYAEEEGIELDGALLAHGFEDGESQVPFSEMQRLITLIKEGCGGSLGLEVGASMAVSSHGSLGAAISHARNLDHCLTLVAEYHRTRTQIADIRFEKDDKLAYIRFSPKTSWGDNEVSIYDSLYMVMFNIVRFAIGKKAEQCVLEYPYPAPEWREAYLKLIPARHVFDQPVAQLTFPASFLSIPCIGSDPSYVRVATEQLQSQMSRLHQDQSMSFKIRDLVKSTKNFKLSLEEAANTLAISKSTLIRKLHLEGETFKSLVEEMKKDYATYMLKKTPYKIDVVSMQLGYDEVANFNRAFKRWFNCTPGRFRKEQPSL